MGGTIETKKDTYSLLNEELVREEFMDLPYEEMTDD